jgi:hypothetical protein
VSCASLKVTPGITEVGETGTESTRAPSGHHASRRRHPFARVSSEEEVLECCKCSRLSVIRWVPWMVACSTRVSAAITQILSDASSIPQRY